MTHELRDRLQTHLGGSYTLERELGGGGMSRVFVGHETALGRRVVVKVLPPDLAAGVNLERFRREIQLAAQLQHPHIVPVHAAGMADGLPYFTMPLVEGESLRVRLARDGPLPIQDACRIAHDVADALAYAHERGVVHRDIKPDNVLMAGSHALVTDFGVAKALSDAKQDGGEGLTMVGTTMGTPAYMAPEQAAADPNSDHRVDIYALGIFAYELLTGRTPFGGRTPQATLAGHLSEPPPPLTAARGEIPQRFESLIMRCLAKNPDDRPQTAAEVARELEVVATSGSFSGGVAVADAAREMLPKALAVYSAAFIAVAIVAKLLTSWIGLPPWVFPTTLVLMALGLPAIAVTAYAHHPTVRTRRSKRGTVHRWLTWKRAAIGGGVVLATFALLVAGHLVLRARGIGPGASLMAMGKLDAREPILVAEFRSPGDSVLGAVISEALRTDLGQSRAVTVVQPAQVRDALTRMQRPVTARVDAQLAQEIAQREGIKAIVDGEIAQLGSGYQITARLASSTGEQLASFRETSRDADGLIGAVDKLSKALRERIGESLRSVRGSGAVALDKVSTGSLDALRRYTQAVQALEVEGDIDRGVSLLEEAITLDTNFAMAYRKLSVALNNAGMRPERAQEAAGVAFAKRDRLTDDERYMTIGTYYSQRDPDRAIAAYQALIDIDPNHRAALNNISILYTNRRDYARAEEMLKRSIAADSSTYTSYLNLINTQVQLGRVSDARATLERMARRFPRAPASTSVRIPLLYLEGKLDSAIAAAQAYRAAYPGNARVRAEATAALAGAALVRGKLGEAERLRREIVAASLDVGLRGAALQNELSGPLEELWFRNRPDRARTQLERAMATHKFDSLPWLERPYTTVAAIYALSGQPQRAREMLAEFERGIDSTNRRLLQPALHSGRAFVALAERRHEDAVRELRAADEGSCKSCTLPYLGMAYDASGNVDSTIAVYERYLATPEFSRPGQDAFFLAPTHKRLGELYDAKDEHERAVEHFSRFIELWKDADAELQPRVQDARRRLELIRRQQGS